MGKIRMKLPIQFLPQKIKNKIKNQFSCLKRGRKEDLWQERRNNSQKGEEKIFVPKTCNW